MNGESFLADMEQCLVPTLKRGDIVVADNVSFHKVAGVEAAIRGVGASLRYLPQYSPGVGNAQRDTIFVQQTQYIIAIPAPMRNSNA
jgi:transposase